MLWTGVAFSEMGLRDRCVIPTLKQSCTVLQAPSGRLQRPGRVEAVPDAVSWPGMFQPVIFRLWLHLHSTLFPSLPCFSSLKWKSKSGHWFVFYLLKHSGHFYSVRHLSLRHLCLLSIVPCPALGSDGGVRKGELENAAGWEGAPLRIQEMNLHRGYLLCPPGTLPQSSTSSNIIWGMYPLILMHIVNLSFPKKQDSLCFALTFSKLEI